MIFTHTHGVCKSYRWPRAGMHTAHTSEQSYEHNERHHSELCRPARVPSPPRRAVGRTPWFVHTTYWQSYARMRARARGRSISPQHNWVIMMIVLLFYISLGPSCLRPAGDRDAESERECGQVCLNIKFHNLHANCLTGAVCLTHSRCAPKPLRGKGGHMCLRWWHATNPIVAVSWRVPIIRQCTHIRTPTTTPAHTIIFFINRV